MEKDLYCISSSNLKIHTFNLNYNMPFKPIYNNLLDDKMERKIYEIKNKNIPDYILLKKNNNKFCEYITGIQVDKIEPNDVHSCHANPVFVTSDFINNSETLKKAIASYEDIDIKKYVEKFYLFHDSGINSFKNYNKKVMELKQKEAETISNYEKVYLKILNYKNS